MKKLSLLFLYLVLFLPLIASCRKNTEETSAVKKLRVIATIFPIYDFSREIAGDRAEVGMLLPPGMEPHSFEPKPEDMIRMSKTDIFIYTNRFMEPWASHLVKGRESTGLLIVDAGDGIGFLPATCENEHGEEEGHSGHGHGGGMDPHIWLDFANAAKMVDNIAHGMAQKDPANGSYYLERAATYKKRLVALDERFKKGLSSCSSRLFLHGGHYAFGYLAARYGLEYRAAYAVSANAEPTPKRVVEIVDLMKKSGQRYIFYEELISPTMADAIARESGASLLKLHGAHNVAREELDGGVTFISLMEENLDNLRAGLQCR